MVNRIAPKRVEADNEGVIFIRNTLCFYHALNTDNDADVVELVDAPDSKSGSLWECGFDSHHPHQVSL